MANSLTNYEKRFQGVTKSPRFNDQYGGFTIGGPAIKNKLFLFGGFTERNISAQNVFNSGGITPTPAGLAQLKKCFPDSTSLRVFDKFGPYSIPGGQSAAGRSPSARPYKIWLSQLRRCAVCSGRANLADSPPRI